MIFRCHYKFPYIALYLESPHPSPQAWAACARAINTAEVCWLITTISLIRKFQLSKNKYLVGSVPLSLLYFFLCRCRKTNILLGQFQSENYNFSFPSNYSNSKCNWKNIYICFSTKRDDEGNAMQSVGIVTEYKSYQQIILLFWNPYEMRAMPVAENDFFLCWLWNGN